MLVKKLWFRGAGATLKAKEGWFLFGIIPIYIRQLNYTGKPVGWKP